MTGRRPAIQRSRVAKASFYQDFYFAGISRDLCRTPSSGGSAEAGLTLMNVACLVNARASAFLGRDLDPNRALKSFRRILFLPGCFHLIKPVARLSIRSSQPTSVRILFARYGEGGDRIFPPAGASVPLSEFRLPSLCCLRVAILLSQLALALQGVSYFLQSHAFECASLRPAG